MPRANQREICHAPKSSQETTNPMRASLGYSRRYKPLQYSSSMNPFNRTITINNAPAEARSFATLGRNETKKTPKAGRNAVRPIHGAYLFLLFRSHRLLKYFRSPRETSHAVLRQYPQYPRKP